MIRLYFIVPAAMCLLALLHMPYGYYQLLRLVVTICAGLFACVGWRDRSHLMVITFGLLALVYNPFVPLALGRPVWEWVNIGTAVFFLLALVIMEWIDRGAKSQLRPAMSLADDARDRDGFVPASEMPRRGGD